jgi:hypothetical protein
MRSGRVIDLCHGHPQLSPRSGSPRDRSRTQIS